MAKTAVGNFDWLDDYEPKTDIERDFLELYYTAQPKPQWSPELDAAIRIILCGANKLASKKENEAILRTLNNKLQKKRLYNSDIILIAHAIINDVYFFCAQSDLVTIKHKEIIIEHVAQIPIEHRVNIYAM